MKLPIQSLFSFGLFAALVAPVAADEVDYVKQIKPILARSCYSCHAALKQESGLRLDTGELIRRGGESGPGIVPKDVPKSLIIQRVISTDEDERMPLEGAPLANEEIALLKKWIELGAPSPADERPQQDPREHWAFRRPVRPDVPEVKNSAWVNNPIDAFIAAEHERRGLAAQPAADGNVLLRRVYLDLIGLPPTRKQLQAFLADTSSEAYENVVQQLLESPQYGERWGRHWMDVWRYSDWYGRRAVNDVRNSYPHIWRWRDWIINSLNDDKGYDRMISEMLAADEIAPEDDGAIAATGFIVRNWFSLNYDQWMKDLVEHTGKAFLGLRFNCAHCHDHKYDPISQQEYFAFRAFFEPLEFRHDRVPGGPDLPKYKRYMPGSGASLVPVAAGLPRIFDENLKAETFMYRMGDARDRFDRPPVAPAAPKFLNGDQLAIQSIDLPTQAWYPGAKSWLQQQETQQREKLIQDAEQALAKARQQHELKLQPLEEAVRKAQAHLKQIEQKLAASPRSIDDNITPSIADTIAYWQFEGSDDQFLNDSSGHGFTLRRVNGKDPQAAPYKLGSASAGRAFLSTIPTTDQSNQQAALFSQRSSPAYLATDAKPQHYANEFTVEALINVGVSQPNFNCGIAELQGSWTWLHRGLNATTSEFRLLLNSAKGAIADIATGNGSQTLRLTTGADYYIALSIDDKHVKLYARNLASDGELQSVTFDRNLDGKDLSTLARPTAKGTFKIGNSGNGTGRHQGLLDEVRYTRGALTSEQIAASAGARPIPPEVAEANEQLQIAKHKLDSAALPIRTQQAQLDDARAQLAAISARIAADNAKYVGGDGDQQQLAVAASKAERRAALSAAKLTLAQAERALVDAQEKAAADAKAKPQVAKAQQSVTSAKSAVAKAEANAVGDNPNYTSLSPQYPRQSTGRRRALAAWIANEQNPLTARVAVNHIWMRHFGRPLVESVFDFGLAGKEPSHPKLLDWLAVEFIESGWKMKHIHRLVVTSSTYRQSSSINRKSQIANRQSADPDNQYLWRFPRRRVEAEVIRDSILHAAGQLDVTIGGPELDNKLAPKSRRRSLYFGIYPEDGGMAKFLTIFDPPDPCDCYRRNASVVPQQALAMTNSQIVGEQAKLLADKLWTEIEKEQPDAEQRNQSFVVAAFQQLLTRHPTDAELKMCGSFLGRQQDLFEKELKGKHTASRAGASLVRVLLSHNDFATVK